MKNVNGSAAVRQTARFDFLTSVTGCGNTAVGQAARVGNAPLLRHLLAPGRASTLVNRANAFQESPLEQLFDVFSTGDTLTAAQALLEHGADPNQLARPHRPTVLNFALGENLALCRLFFQHGAQLRAKLGDKPAEFETLSAEKRAMLEQACKILAEQRLAFLLGSLRRADNLIRLLPRDVLGKILASCGPQSFREVAQIPATVI
jgi:hypothetical protein